MTELLNLGLNVVLIALLGGVIYFVTRLHSRLEIVRSGKEELEALLGNLMTATSSAERSLTGLRERAEDLTETLGKQVKGAENAREELSYLLASADRSAAELVRLVDQSKQNLAKTPLAAMVPNAAPVEQPAAANAQPKAQEQQQPAVDSRRQAENDLLKAIEKLR